MRVEIDQSNKIEKTNKDTVIGLADSKKFTVLISAKVKRKLQEEFRKQGKTRLFVYRTFIAGVVLLLKYSDLSNLTHIIIDQEYYGQDKILKSMFLEMWMRYFFQAPEISFSRIGKKSEAHNISYFTAKGKYKPNKKLSFGELRQLVLK